MESLRAKGFFWLATRHDIAAEWSQAGKVTTVGAAGEWLAALDSGELAADPELFDAAAEAWKEPYGDRRQELVFIGSDMNEEQIHEELTACLLNEAEFDRGPSGWMPLEDPFPVWESIDAHDHASPAELKQDDGPVSATSCRHRGSEPHAARDAKLLAQPMA